MSSKFEGMPMVLIESSLHGLPAVSFNINTGPSDIISNGESGFLISDGDIDGFASKLQILMHDDSMRQNFGIRSKEIAASKFSKERVIGMWSELFDELLSS